jgi:hypothetical protein
MGGGVLYAAAFPSAADFRIRKLVPCRGLKMTSGSSPVIIEGRKIQIYVQTRDHVVCLSGIVSTGLMSEAAAAAARGAPGVTRVENSIAVAN